LPLYLIERDFAEAVGESTDNELQELLDYNGSHELRWLFSFLSADKRRSYCLYEAPNPEALEEQARALGYPADKIIEVSEASAAVAMGGESVSGFSARW
jgi:hypothetical protein